MTTSLLLLLACEGEPPPATEAGDVAAICEAIYAADWASEEQWDVQIQAARVGTERGLELQRQLVEGPARSPESIQALVEAMRETGANESSIDCAVVEGYAPTLKPADEEASSMDPEGGPG